MRHNIIMSIVNKCYFTDTIDAEAGTHILNTSNEEGGSETGSCYVKKGADRTPRE
jgi:hypothetical protein